VPLNPFELFSIFQFLEVNPPIYPEIRSWKQSLSHTTIENSQCSTDRCSHKHLVKFRHWNIILICLSPFCS